LHDVGRLQERLDPDGRAGVQESPKRGAFLAVVARWRPVRIVATGLESPVQLGATFLADAEQLRSWYAGTAPLTDDYPKRIAPVNAIANPTPEYLAWLKPDDARRRFQTSQWVAKHWPGEFTQASAPFFAIQPALNGELANDPIEDMPYVDAILRNSDLRIPVLWLLGSDVNEQEIVNRRLQAERLSRRVRLSPRVRALAERDYALAGELFAEAAKREPRPAASLAACAMCLHKLHNDPGCWTRQATSAR
jgi:hypothetical protein